MKIKYVAALVVLVLIQSVLSENHAQTVTQWRGADRTGYFPSNNLLREWPAEGPELFLQIDSLTASYSTVVLHDSVMYTTGISDDEEFLTAINLDGTIRWNIAYGKAWGKTFSNARCTPTIEGDNAYVISGSGNLACINIQQGNLKWSFDGFEKFSGLSGRWGVAESPLIVDNKMIYTPCGEKTTMVAVDKNRGETIWVSESLGDQSAYCSPALTETGQFKLIITVTGNYVICVNAENGEIFWKFEYTNVDKPLTGEDINPVTPIIIGRDVFVTSGYNHVGVMLHMANDYRSVSMKWKTSDLDVHHGGVVYHDGYLYGANFTGIRKGNWVCLDWETGTVQYEKEWYAKGSTITSDGLLICYEERRGNIALVEATPDEFAIKSTFRIEQGKGPHWSHPTIYDDKLFIRHGKSLMVYNIGVN